jgi:hypothetical protein
MIPTSKEDPVQAQLIVISGPDQGRAISLAEGQTLTIGRGESAAANSDA